MAYLNFTLPGKKITDDNYFIIDGEETKYHGIFDGALYNLADGEHIITLISPNGTVFCEVSASASEMVILRPGIDSEGNITGLEYAVSKLDAQQLEAIKKGAKNLGEITTNNYTINGKPGRKWVGWGAGISAVFAIGLFNGLSNMDSFSLKNALIYTVGAIIGVLLIVIGIRKNNR